jgi:hypothetical protein
MLTTKSVTVGMGESSSALVVTDEILTRVRTKLPEIRKRTYVILEILVVIAKSRDDRTPRHCS